ncbi:hypothetical protein CH330_01085 [candidate division WOR-3 bacterium JGI_Cruoil_03_51_56]|uniref:TRAM domain-containing protein n=1 Tax=candidate division WOR-3 bacterium JGI_Cruoil_03_51_56 TaxID=1973747 RepID=A0A235BZ19_UNCW3|nr:MAG: hypothetical protein CH330_01085 [candidate division WOR-3 bacterium JGI_Cruoil_03_51_56]
MFLRKTKTFVMDFETVADPRIAQFLEMGLISGKFFVPEPPTPVSSSAQADHRTRRAWETIERLRHIKGITVKLNRNLLQRDALIAALRKYKATLITVNPDLKAACNGLAAITISEIYNLFKPLFLPGTQLRVRVSKRGKEKNEGIGYLEGGVKVVIENGAAAQGRDLEVIVQGTLETNVGRVVFAKPKFTEI